jgi:hypothetical protein
MVSTVSPEASLILNLGLRILHSWRIDPISEPGGAVTSMVYFGKCGINVFSQRRKMTPTI